MGPACPRQPWLRSAAARVRVPPPRFPGGWQQRAARRVFRRPPCRRRSRQRAHRAGRQPPRPRRGAPRGPFAIEPSATDRRVPRARRVCRSASVVPPGCAAAVRWGGRAAARALLPTRAPQRAGDRRRHGPRQCRQHRPARAPAAPPCVIRPVGNRPARRSPPGRGRPCRWHHAGRWWTDRGGRAPAGRPPLRRQRLCGLADGQHSSQNKFRNILHRFIQQ